jgi:hypothetical protein
MAREKDGYRDNLAILNERYPEHDMLTIEQVMQVTGHKSRATVRKHFGSMLVNKRLSKAALARYMCG